MNNRLTLDEALKKNLVPQKKYSKRETFLLEHLEDAVSEPRYVAKKNAQIFTLKSGKEIFRKAEAEKTYKKEVLLDFRISAEEIKNTKPALTITVKKKPVKLYTLESFNYKNIILSPTDFYNDLILENNDFEVCFISTPYEKYDYELDEINPYFYDTNKYTRISFFKDKTFSLQIEVNIPLRKQSIKGKEVQFMLETLQDYISFAKEKINKTLEEISKTSLNLYPQHLFLSLDKNNDFSENLKDYINTNFETEIRKETFGKLLSKKPYHELFPARKINRNIIIFEAPTNSGKTYNACNEVVKYIEEKDAKGVCMFPLRVLAAQLKDEFMDRGIPCSLITGEERELEENAKLECITTEAVSVEKLYKVAFIDESQLLFDDQRGSAYAKAILGTNAETIILAVAPAYKESLTYWLKRVLPDDTIEERTLERLCPLHVLEQPTNISQVKPGDLIVAFSAREIHWIANELSFFFKVGVIYGKMSPAARRAMVRSYMQEGFEVLVATDSIGMGISVPVKRVLFSTLTKYDGKQERKLRDEEIRQIGGRAGRFGFHEEGFVGVYNSNNNNLNLIKNVLRNPIKQEPTPAFLTISPDKHIFLSAQHLSLVETIEVWEKAALSKDYTINVSVNDELKKKAYFLDELTNVNKKNIVDVLFISFAQDKNDSWFKKYKNTTLNLFSGKSISLSSLEEWHQDVEYFEDFAATLTLISQFQRIFPDLCPKEEEIMHLQTECGEKMSELLNKKYAEQKSKKKR